MLKQQFVQDPIISLENTRPCRKISVVRESCRAPFQWLSVCSHCSIHTAGARPPRLLQRDAGRHQVPSRRSPRQRSRFAPEVCCHVHPEVFGQLRQGMAQRRSVGVFSGKTCPLRLPASGARDVAVFVCPAMPTLPLRRNYGPSSPSLARYEREAQARGALRDGRMAGQRHELPGVLSQEQQGRCNRSVGEAPLQGIRGG